MAEEVATIPVLVVTGPVGVGKSAVAVELSNRLRDLQVPHAVVDMDWLRACYPSPPHDRFHMALGLRNLAAIWANYRAARPGRLIIVDIVETRSALNDYHAAIPNAEIVIIRLDATISTIHRRLEGRESGASLAWHKHRAAELSKQWAAQPVEDLIIETEGKTVAEVTEEVLALAGWLRASTA
jgi:predicted kinase